MTPAGLNLKSMDTNLVKTSRSPIPAGIFSGIEAFWFENEKWVLYNGTKYRYNEAPTNVKAIIQKEFMNDKKSLSYIKKIGITAASEVFDTWYRCVVGGLDSTPDFGKKFIPDSYNNMCSDMNCHHRGKLCSRDMGLKNYEVVTLIALKRGESMEQTAQKICVSLPGMKSRVEKIKTKMNVSNMASLIAIATEIGI